MGRNRKLTLTSGPTETGQIDFKPLSGDSDPLNGVTLKGPDSVGASPLELVLPASVVADGVYKSDGSGSQSVSKITDINVDSAAAIALTKLANLTINRALASDASGVIVPSTTTDTELGYVSGVTSAVQAQIDSKQDASTAVTLNDVQTLTNKTLSGNTATNLINGSGTLDLNSSGTITVPNATDTLVGQATADTLTNKTFGDEITTDQISTPSTPASGKNKLYFKNDDLLYTLDSAGNEVPVASAAPPLSEVYVYAQSSYCSNGDNIITYATVGLNTGSDILYAVNTVSGDTFTIQTSGVYSISMSSCYLSVGQIIGMSKNTTQPGTSISSINPADVVMMTGAFTNLAANVSICTYLTAGDVLRAHLTGNSLGSASTSFGTDSFVRIKRVS